MDSSCTPKTLSVQYTRAVAPKSVSSKPVESTITCDCAVMPKLCTKLVNLGKAGNSPGLLVGPRHTS